VKLLGSHRPIITLRRRDVNVKTLGEKQGRSDIEVEEGTSQRRKEMDEVQNGGVGDSQPLRSI
jgi:hypothetical protein